MTNESDYTSDDLYESNDEGKNNLLRILNKRPRIKNLFCYLK